MRTFSGQFPIGFRAWGCVAISLIAISPGMAREVTLQCPEVQADKPKLSVRFDADVLSVTDANGTSTLAGRIETAPSGMFGIEGWGPMQARMPDPVVLDACLAAELKAQGATAKDSDTVAWAANLCQSKLMPTGTMQTIDAHFAITALEPTQAMLFIERRFTVPSAVTGEPVMLPEFPTRDCQVLTGP